MAVPPAGQRSRDQNRSAKNRRHLKSKSSMQRYTLPVILLHWIIALLIIGAFTLGLVMTDMPAIANQTEVLLMA
jgi:hypothetical protein